jgi:hypothetical protein
MEEPVAVTTARARKLALSLPDTAEVAHFDRAAFRTPRKIFATLANDGADLNVMFDLATQEFFCEQAPQALAPHPSGWGKQGATRVDLKRVDEATLLSALKAAHALAAPNRSRPRRRRSKKQQRRRNRSASPSGRFHRAAMRCTLQSFAAIRLRGAGVDHNFVDARPQWTRRASSELIVWRLITVRRLKGFVQHYRVNVKEFGVRQCSKNVSANLVRPARRRCNGAAPHFAPSSATSRSARGAALRSNCRA